MIRRFKIFQNFNLVMVHLSKEHCCKLSYKKLNVRNIGPFKIKSKFRDNTYEVEFSQTFDIWSIFITKGIYDFASYGLEEIDEYKKENIEAH
jgi:hypothetical protein